MKSTLRALRGFHFADPESVRNAEYALNPNRPSAFIIMGEACTGKTLLAKLILRRVFGFAPGGRYARTTAEIEKIISYAVDQGFLFLEHPAEKLLKCPTLFDLAVSFWFSFRRRQRSDPVWVTNNCLTVITTGIGDIPPILACRANVIRMVAVRKGKRKFLPKIGGAK